MYLLRGRSTTLYMKLFTHSDGLDRVWNGRGNDVGQSLWNEETIFSSMIVSDKRHPREYRSWNPFHCRTAPQQSRQGIDIRQGRGVNVGRWLSYMRCSLGLYFRFIMKRVCTLQPHIVPWECCIGTHSMHRENKLGAALWARKCLAMEHSP
jgi:hypothetical protein